MDLPTIWRLEILSAATQTINSRYIAVTDDEALSLSVLSRDIAKGQTPEELQPPINSAK